MVDAMHGRRERADGLTSANLRARAVHRRETAGRLWDERLERLLLEEADELDRRAAALELESAVGEEGAPAVNDTVQPDRAARREDGKQR